MDKKKYPRNDPSGGLRQTSECCPTLQYDSDQLEFIQAMQRYQRERGRKFPAYSEVLQVLLDLGYRKVKS